MKFDPRHLEILAAVVEAGGITEGAAALGKSQPSVSRSMALLESRVGAALFMPKKKPVQPTKIGLELSKEGKRILDAGRAASKKLDLFHAGKSGIIRLAGTPIFMDGAVSGLVAEFQNSFPEVNIDQTYGYADELVQQIEIGALDMGILPLRSLDMPKHLECSKILLGKNLVTCRPGHPLLARKHIGKIDLVEFSWIAPPPDSLLFQDMTIAFEDMGRDALKIVFTGRTLSSIINILQKSDALTLLPSSVVFMQRGLQMLTTLPIDLGTTPRNLSVVQLKKQRENGTVDRLTHFLKSRFQSLALAIHTFENKSFQD